MEEKELEKHRQDIGRQCAIWRKQKGLSQNEMAKELGISRDIIHRIEKGVSSYTVDSLIRYADHLGRTIELTQIDEL